MLGSDLHGSWEISAAPEKLSGGAGKVNDRNPAINAAEKSDALIVPKKQGNACGAKEPCLLYAD